VSRPVRQAFATAALLASTPAFAGSISLASHDGCASSGIPELLVGCTAALWLGIAMGATFGLSFRRSMLTGLTVWVVGMLGSVAFWSFALDGELGARCNAIDVSYAADLDAAGEYR
jgi:hypothetical protein